MKIKLNNQKIKAVFTDIDGVWTDGGMYYSAEGEYLKKFNTSDSAGVLFLRELETPLVIITGENSESVQRRIEKLKIKPSYFGVKNKLEIAKKYCAKKDIDLSSEVAYIGNDINDLQLLKAVAHSAAPKDAPDYIKKHVDVVMTKKGGEGVFREYVEFLINQNGSIQDFVEQHYLEN